MHPYLITGVSLGPSLVRRLATAIPEAQYDEALDNDRFTVREIVAHLADWEVLFRGRMEAALQSPGVAIVTFDEGERAIEREYSKLEVEDQLVLYEMERAKTVEFLSGLSPDQFRLQYVHPQLGQLVIEDQANMLIGHDMYHIEQLTSYLYP
jgi:hypothetical protein